MAKKFVTTREITLIDGWNRELIQDTSKQWIVYYPISLEESRIHDVYEEAIEKAFGDPIRINARVSFSQGSTTAAGGTLDSTYITEAFLHTKECEERNLRPREGDYFEYGQIFYEITSVGHDEPVFGQIDEKIEYKLTCIPSREGQFAADNDTQNGIDNSHPVEPARPRTLGDDL